MKGKVFLTLMGSLFLRPAAAQPPPVANSVQVSLSGSALSIEVSGSLDFGSKQLTGYDQVLHAVSTPLVQVIDATGSGTGWSVTAQASDLAGPQGNLPASSLSFHSTGGSLQMIRGLSIGSGGPAETNLVGTLEQSLKVLSTQSDAGMGTYQWRPANSSFSLSVPAAVRAGTYQGLITFSIMSGP